MNTIERFINGEIGIRLRTNQEWVEFMELIEKETEAKWTTGVKGNPTGFNFWRVYQDKTVVKHDPKRFNTGLEYFNFEESLTKIEIVDYAAMNLSSETREELKQLVKQSKLDLLNWEIERAEKHLETLKKHLTSVL